MMMVDSGALHNFIFPQVMIFLEILVTTHEMGIQLKVFVPIFTFNWRELTSHRCSVLIWM